MAASATLIAILPELLVTLPKIGEGIYNLLNANRDQLPEDQQAALANVKARQAAADAEWDAGLAVAGDVSPASPPVTYVAAAPVGDADYSGPPPGSDPE